MAASRELYKKTKIGASLLEALDDMVSNGSISPELAFHVFIQFEESLTESLQIRVECERVKLQTLNDIVSGETLSADDAIQAFVHFNKAINPVPVQKKKKKNDSNKVSIMGNVHTNRCYMNVRTIIVHDAVLKINKARKNLGSVTVVTFELNKLKNIKRLTVGENVKFCL